MVVVWTGGGKWSVEEVFERGREGGGCGDKT